MENTRTLQSLVTGFRISSALSVAAELGLSDELVAGPRSLDSLASAVGADRETLERLLRALVALGVYALEDDLYSNTAMGEELRSDVPGSVRPLARTLQDPALWAAWGHLAHSVRTGENAFQALHGVDVWTHRQGLPEQNAVFNDTMTALSWDVGSAVAESYDFSEFGEVVDVGGGQGILLDAVMTKNPGVRGIVFDQAHVVATAPRSAGLEDRWSAVSGNFFESVPAADAYLLKSILHDWRDEQCVQILRTCAASLKSGGRILVVETVLGRSGQEVAAAFSDLNMLVLPGGKERGEAEYAELFAAADLRLTRVVDTASRMSILEASV